jgi:VanZ family protein
MELTGALLYMVLLGFGATIRPEVGVAGSLLALVPQPVTEYAHVPAYAVLTWLLTCSLEERGWPKRTALCLGAVAAMGFGVSMELLQEFVPGREVSIGDLASNAIGIGLASLLIGYAPERADRFLPARMR